MTAPARLDAGRLTISDRALATIAARAAWAVPGVTGVRRRGRRRAGRPVPGTPPRVSARWRGDTADLVVTCSMPYPDPVADTARQVRAAVADGLAAYAGVPAVRVTIEVPALDGRRRHDRRLSAPSSPGTPPGPGASGRPA
jgi:uncharacterized alkaline shock family protein YloU